MLAKDIFLQFTTIDCLSIEDYYQNLQQLSMKDRIARLHALKEFFEHSLNFIYNQLRIDEKEWEDFKSSLYFSQLRKDSEEMKRRALEEAQAFRDSLH